MTNVLTSHRSFIFSNSKDFQTPSSINILIQETVDSEFGSYLWPSSVVLGQYIWHNREHFSKKSFLEIGAGTALPSIIALKCAQPKHVVITDKSCFSRDSLHLNGIRCYADHYACDEEEVLINFNEIVHLLPLSWNEVSYKCIELLSHCLPDVILGSDCFYDPALFDVIVSTIYFLLRSYYEATHKQKNAKFYCTYQTRSLDWSIADLLQEWGLKYRPIPLECFEANSNDIARSGMPGDHTIQMFELSLK